jgi:hypothetical protein
MMSRVALGAVIFAAIYLFVTIARYWRTDASRAAKAWLIGIRLAALVLIILAFTQPSLMLRRLLPGGARTAVMIDNSRSMQLFGPDSLLKRVMTLCRSARPGNGPELFCFGDSLRPCAARATPQLDDRRSYFPTSGYHSTLSHAHRLVIVSDGNWSNARLPHEALQGKECFYLNLPPPRPAPYLLVEPLDPQTETVVGQQGSFRIAVTSVLPAPSTLRFSCLENGRRIADGTRPFPAGFAKDTFDITVPARRPGRHLCRVAVQTDSLGASCYVTHTVVPSRFTVATYADRPRLDLRYLTLALTREEGWEVLGPPGKGQATDLLILFDWDTVATRLVSSVRRSGAVLFAGALPCDSVRSLPPTPRSIPVIPTDIEVEHRLPLDRMPPLATLASCAGRSPVTAPHPVVSLLNATGARPDSQAVVFTGMFRRRTAIVCAARGFWRWDFWTQFLQDGTLEEFPFSRFLLRLARNRLTANLSAALLVHPTRLPLHEATGIELALSLPATLDWSVPARVALQLHGTDGTTLYDTSFLHANPARRAYVRVPPSPRGTYVYTAELQSRGVTLRASDTLTVREDRSELLVAGQNVQLLSELARPVDPSDEAALRDVLLDTTAVRVSQTVPYLVRIRQTWVLLLMLLGLLFAEWIVRRRLLLD